MSKFQRGEKVRIINYGHKIWTWEDAFPGMPILRKYTDGSYEFDLQPELVGKEGIIHYATDNIDLQNQYQITGIPEKICWYNDDQLELVDNETPALKPG